MHLSLANTNNLQGLGMILTVGKCINICDSSSNDEIWTTILERKGLRKMHIKLRSRVILANNG